jgi:predicted nucleic acid-binding protein
VAVVYLDTSALGRVLLGEPDAPAVLRELGAFELRVASRLLRVELRRLALREGLLADADQLLRGVALLAVDDDVLTAAETVTPSSVATLDAIHLATALRLAASGQLDAVMTYDARLADGAREHGLAVLEPGKARSESAGSPSSSRSSRSASK